MDETETLDVIVVGGGPAGMTFAHGCAREGQRVLLIEYENVLGGCHRVRRIGNRFSEHGPRVYVGAYASFDRTLTRAGIGGMAAHFTQFKGTESSKGSTLPTAMDGASLIWAFIWFLATNRAHDGSVAEWAKSVGATEQTLHFLDGWCSKIEGAGASRFSFRELLQAGNQLALHSSILQPIKPNDLGFVRAWENSIRSTGTQIHTGVRIVSVARTDNGVCEICDSEGNIYQAGKIVFAIPPAALSEIQGADTAFGADLAELARKTAYDCYVPVTIEWASKNTNTSKRSINYTETAWRVIAVEMSATTDFGDSIVVSAAASRLDRASPVTGLTANQTTDRNAFAREVLRQFMEMSEGFPSSTEAALLVGTSSTNNGDGWVDTDSAYLRAAHTREIPAASDSMPGIYTLGAHNRRSSYELTSIESAVANADALLYDWFKKPAYAPVQATTLRWALGVGLFVVFAILLLLKLFTAAKSKPHRSCSACMSRQHA